MQVWGVMTGTHVVEECPELEQKPRRAEWREVWREALGGRAERGVEEAIEAILRARREKKEDADVLKTFSHHIY